MREIIIICGPTAVGKTKTSLKIARKLDTQIVSADAMQIYKKMDIGTAKILPKERQGIVHHMIDIVESDQEYSVSEYYKTASAILEEMFQEGNIPVVVGGTGLYINSLIYKMDFNTTKSDAILRDKYQKMYEEKGTDYLYEKLKEKDLLFAQKIEKNNIKRVIRALEIAESRQSVKAFEEVKKFHEYKVHLFVLYLDRTLLYERINKRVDDMIEQGLVEEVEYFLHKGLDENTQAMKAIGYRQILAYLKGDLDRNTAIELIKRDSRRYAKRQYTWFKRYSFAHWIDMQQNSTNDVVEKILSVVKKK